MPPHGYAPSWPAPVLAAMLAATLAACRGNAPAELSIYPPEGDEFAIAYNVTVPVPQFALSPDGRFIVFAAGPSGALWVRRLDDDAARLLEDTQGAQNPFWSPDSRWIGFFADSRIKKIPAAGGPVQVIAEDVSDARGASWGPDNTVLFSRGNTPVYRVSANGGAVNQVTALDTARSEVFHRWPHFLPDGRRFLYTIQGPASGERGVYVGSLDGSVKKHLASPVSSAVYADGFVLFVEGPALMAQRFDSDRLEVSGAPLTVAPRAARSTTYQGAFSASPGGVVAYAGLVERGGRLEWYDRKGKRLAVEAEMGDYSTFRLSPGQETLAVSLVDPQTGNPDIWFHDLERGGREQKTFGPNFNAQPVFSPDGAHIALRASPRSGAELYRRRTAAGAHLEALLPAEIQRAERIQPFSLAVTDWSSDGRNIVFSAASSSDTDLWLLPSNGGRGPARLKAAGDQMHGNFSPDARLVAYTSSETGRFEVHVRSLAASGNVRKVSGSGGYEPRWRADGRELFFLSGDRKLMAVAVDLGPVFGTPRALFQTQAPAGVNPLRTHYVPSGDGSRFLINTQPEGRRPAPVTVIRNWHRAELWRAR